MLSAVYHPASEGVAPRCQKRECVSPQEFISGRFFGFGVVFWFFGKQPSATPEQKGQRGCRRTTADVPSVIKRY